MLCITNYQVAIFQNRNPGCSSKVQGCIIFQAGFEVAFDGQTED